MWLSAAQGFCKAARRERAVLNQFPQDAGREAAFEKTRRTSKIAAAFTHDVEAMRDTEFRKFVKSAKEFFKSFESLNFKDLSTAHIQKMLNAHNLAMPELFTRYSKKLRNLK